MESADVRKHLKKGEKNAENARGVAQGELMNCGELDAGNLRRMIEVQIRQSNHLGKAAHLKDAGENSGGGKRFAKVSGHEETSQPTE